MELFFDTETSGFRKAALGPNDPQQAWIVQLGAILSTSDQIIAEVNFLIKPEGRSINPGAQKIHGLSTAIADKGLYEDNVARIFALMLDNADILVCHNYKFDIYLVKDLLERNSMMSEALTLMAKPHYCTMLNSTQLCKLPSRYKGKYKWPKLTELHQFLFGCEFEGAHDAMADVRATRSCYYKLMDQEEVKDASRI